MHPGQAFGLLWAGWLISWLAAAVWSRPTAGQPLRGEQAGYMLTQTLGAALLGASATRAWDGAFQLWRIGDAAGFTLVAIAALGLVFCWWARLHLGALWSGTVTRKAEHRVVDTGPYRLVRHPIYTGLILALAATAAWAGRPFALAGAALIVLALWMKARLEERFLRAQLGTAYEDYVRRTPMLIPFLTP